jgi:N-acetylneuraminate synthase
VYIVAEIGINHNGDIDIAKKLIDLSFDCDCDAVKFQKRDINLVYSQENLDSERESPWGTTQREQKEGLEFGLKEYSEIDSYCKHKKIDWFASAWDLESLHFLKKFDCPKNKIASAMIVDKAFIREVAKEKKHTFISTGMCNMEEVEFAVNIFKEEGCPFELMHTVSTYPMKSENANLNVINTLKEKFNCDVGYSGHESGLAISYAAAALGITSLERHITLDRAMYGSDQPASLGPAGLKQLVGAIRKIEVAMGDGVKRIIDEEIPIAKKLREHISTQKNY